MLPSYVKTAMERLNTAGHVSYIVGGSVRDFLLKKETKDHDIATSAHPDELERLFPNSVTVGKAFGVLKVPVSTLGAEKDSGKLVEIATFREDLEYKNHRHPKKVRFSNAVDDAKRRDFTINALYYDPKTSRILDPTQGMADLDLGIVRAIGDPDERFQEDALRLLRAVRFTTRFSFTLDSATAAAIRARAKLLPKVSQERIREELTLMWTGKKPADSLKLLAQLGLLAQVLPELEKKHRAETRQWSHSLRLLDALEAQNPVRSATLAWAAVLVNVGKEGTREGDLDGFQIALEIATRLRMSRNEIAQIEQLIINLPKFREVFQMREATLERFVHEPYFEELLALHKADAAATDGNLAYYEFVVSRHKASLQSRASFGTKLLDGTDLIQMGLSPGPEFSNILRVVEDLALERKLHTKEEALEYVMKKFVR